MPGRRLREPGGMCEVVSFQIWSRRCHELLPRSGKFNTVAASYCSSEYIGDDDDDDDDDDVYCLLILCRLTKESFIHRFRFYFGGLRARWSIPSALGSGPECPARVSPTTRSCSTIARSRFRRVRKLCLPAPNASSWPARGSGPATLPPMGRSLAAGLPGALPSRGARILSILGRQNALHVAS